MITRSKPLPTRTYLRECFEYDPMSGVATWLERPIEHFETCRARATWNSNRAWGKVGSKNNNGYYSTFINNEPYLLHRLIWKWWYGTEPLIIDHIDRDKTNNRIVNLRSVTRHQNCHNRNMNNNNTSGYAGIDHIRGRWRARTQLNKETIHIGLYDTLNEAIAAIKEFKEA